MRFNPFAPAANRDISDTTATSVITCRGVRLFPIPNLFLIRRWPNASNGQEATVMEAFAAGSPPPPGWRAPSPQLLDDASEAHSEGATASSASDTTVDSTKKFPLVVSNRRWRSEVCSFTVRREAEFITTCTVISPVPRWGHSGRPLFLSLPHIRIGAIFRQPKLLRDKGKEKVDDDDQSTEEEVAQISKHTRRRSGLAGLGWIDIFAGISGNVRNIDTPDFVIDEDSDRLVFPKLDIRVDHSVKQEVEVVQDDEMELLRILSRDAVMGAKRT